ncbi:MAG: acyl-CoA carboxylase subunit beta, partial [Chloroflexus sp.]|nr:acyl-CoA carboxylase subunit beta [Chloroflexus sp.]
TDEDQRVPGDGTVTGFGKINGRRVAVYAQDFTVMGGSFSAVQANKICRMQDLAIESGIPIIGLNDSGGARIQEGVRSLAAYGEVFVRNVLASGVVPQISAILGPCAGGAVYSPALTDFIIMSESTGYMFLTGPDVIKAVSGRDLSTQELGGAAIHCTRSGVAHLSAPDDRAVIELIKRLLSYLPQNNSEDPPQLMPYDRADRIEPALNTLVPADERQGYDVHTLINLIFDYDSFLEIQPLFAQNAVVGFARLDGYAVGVVANQPAIMAGALDIDASDKIARFVRICDAFNIPLITFVDTPGFLPGIEQEYGGVIRHGAKIIYAYSAVMGAEGAVRILRREELRTATDPVRLMEEFVADYRRRYFNPYHAADLGQIDEVIEPAETRPRLIRALEILRTKVQQNPPRKHGLYPS